MGIELKDSYFEWAYRNIMEVVQEKNQVSIFDFDKEEISKFYYKEGGTMQ